MMDGYSVVPAVLSDLPEIIRIERSSFADPWSDRMLREELENSDAVFFTAKDANRILGYISGQQLADEFYINNIAVREDRRKQGVGSALLGRMIETAKTNGCVFITLEVRVSNKTARSLYESFGFIPLGERKDYYEHPRENAVIYTLYFDTAEKTDEHTID